MTAKKRVRWKEGDVVRIPLGGGFHCFGRVLASPLVAFYGVRTDTTPTVAEVVRQPILFQINVMHNAVKSGRWPVVGNAPLEPSLQSAPKFFRQDALTDKLYISRNDVEIPATRKQVEGLECLAVWDAEHVEDRLRDHFAGKPNLWAESLKPK